MLRNGDFICQNINDPLRMICSVGLKDTYGNETSGFEHNRSYYSKEYDQKALFQ